MPSLLLYAGSARLKGSWYGLWGEQAFGGKSSHGRRWVIITHCGLPFSSLPMALGESSCDVLRDRFPRSLSSLDPCLDTEPFPSSGYWHYTSARAPYARTLDTHLLLRDDTAPTSRPLLVALDPPRPTAETSRPRPRVFLTTLDARAPRLGRRRRTRPTSAGTPRAQSRLRPVSGDR